MAQREDESPSEPGGSPAPDGTRGADGPDVVNRYPGTGVSALLVGIFAVLVLAIVFLAQNTESVPIEFLIFDAETPLFVILLATLAASSIATLLLAELWRSRRRRQRADHEELERLRRDRPS